jgi:HPt (histidine-containing phosphotransfer) domain-containing protein
MQRSIPELTEAIERKEYKKIALTAHSIKGSSGNFRMETLQNTATQMEEMAKKEEKDFDYKLFLQMIKDEIEKIKII